MRCRLNALKFALLLALFATTGCDNKRADDTEEEADSNPLKSYINEPKEKAKQAKQAVEKSQEEVDRQFDEITQDD
jgi:hypothetical protein